MAVGDTVSAIGALGTMLSFQPAVSVEVLITWSANSDSYDTFALTDGVGEAWQYNKGGDTQDINQSNLKMLINNTNYMTFSGGTLPVTRREAFTGVQTQ